jgi:hypothetical protein
VELSKGGGECQWRSPEYDEVANDGDANATVMWVVQGL